MGFERLFSGTLWCYCRQFRVVNIQQKVSQAASISTQSSSSTATVFTRAMCVGGLRSRILLHTTRLGDAHSPLAVRRSLSTSAQVSRDVTLFEHDRTRFFRLFSVFCGGQFLFWTYLAHFAYTGLRDTRAATEKGEVTTTALAGMWSVEMNLGSSVWRYGFTLACLTMGVGLVGLASLFCRRSVNQVVLHRGGRTVTVITQSPLGPGRGRRITVPLSQVGCYAHRHESPSFIPLRIKGHKFYFLLDKEGTVTNVRLFDTTVGAYRPV